MPELWGSFVRDGVEVAWRDFGGASSGGDAVLLHGLAGHAGEWEATAAWLGERARVVAVDARGHGRSERKPADVSLGAQVADVVALIGELGGGPVVVVGQSLGGVAGLLVAAEHPALVRALVLVDASPEPAEAAAVARTRAALEAWPEAFASEAEALAFFGGATSVVARAWVAGLDVGADGWLRPRLDTDVVMGMLERAARQDAWAQWSRVRCPALVVRAGHGIVPADQVARMVAALPHARVAEMAGAPHDLHLVAPQEWHAALTAFLDAVAC